MNSSQIAIQIFKELFNKDTIHQLYEKKLLEIGDCTKTIYPDNFPDEIDNPILSDGYNNPFYNGNQNHDNSLVLGSYTPMNSPGVITFYKNNIKRYAGSLIRKVVNSGISLGLDTALFTIYFVVDDIMQHESFHYYCDYKRQLTSSNYDYLKEEAFAVAHSYQEKSRWHTFYHAFMHGSEFNSYFSDYFSNTDIIRKEICRNRMEYIFDYLMVEHYKGFTLPGYKDWILYKKSSCYETDFFNYLKNNQLDVLLANGVPVNDISWEISHIGNKGAIINMV